MAGVGIQMQTNTDTGTVPKTGFWDCARSHLDTPMPQMKDVDQDHNHVTNTKHRLINQIY